MKTERVIGCAWCFNELYRTGLVPTHRDENGVPLFDLNHQSGIWIDDATSDRISADGP